MRKKTPPIKKEYDKALARALVELNKIFTLKELEKKFTVKASLLSKYKRKKILKPLKKDKAKEIKKYYQKLIRRENLEDLEYSYDVRNYKIKPVLRIAITRIKELEEVIIKTMTMRGFARRIGVPIKTIRKWSENKIKKAMERYAEKKVAEKLGVSYRTIRRWKKNKVKRIQPKYIRRLHEIHTKTIKPMTGIFLFTSFNKRAEKDYDYFVYESDFWGTEKTFIETITRRESERGARLKDYIIKKKGYKFSIDEAEEYIQYLKKTKYISKKHYENNKRTITTFIHDNFKGAELKTLMKKLRKHAK